MKFHHGIIFWPWAKDFSAFTVSFSPFFLHLSNLFLHSVFLFYTFKSVLYHILLLLLLFPFSPLNSPPSSTSIHFHYSFSLLLIHLFLLFHFSTLDRNFENIECLLLFSICFILMGTLFLYFLLYFLSLLSVSRFFISSLISPSFYYDSSAVTVFSIVSFLSLFFSIYR